MVGIPRSGGPPKRSNRDCIVGEGLEHAADRGIFVGAQRSASNLESKTDPTTSETARRARTFLPPRFLLLLLHFCAGTWDRESYSR